MHRIQLLILCVCFLVIAYIERQIAFLPLTWVLVSSLALRSKPSILFLILLSVIADLFLALPFGMSALVISVFTLSHRHIPKRPLLFVTVAALLGICMGAIYCVLRGSVGIQIPIVTGIASAFLYTFGSRSVEIEEVGNA